MQLVAGRRVASSYFSYYYSLSSATATAGGVDSAGGGVCGRRQAAGRPAAEDRVERAAAAALLAAWQSVRTSPASGRNESRDTSHSLQKLFDRSSDNVRMEQGFALETSSTTFKASSLLRGCRGCLKL